MRKSRSDESEAVDLDATPGGLGVPGAADHGGQSGDTQGLPTGTGEAEESVEELAESGQGFEAGWVEGMEDAADHPEKPMVPREDQRRPADDGPKPDTA